MLLKQNGVKGSKPYITFKPGVYGSLDVRFFTDWTQWRSPQIFHYPNPKDILQVKLSYNQYQNESFTISQNKDEIRLFDSGANSIDQIAYTAGPGLLGTLLIGENFAQGLALSLNKPLISHAKKL